MTIRLSPDPFDPQSELAAFIERAQGAGAVVSFIGLARGQTRGGAAVERLFLDHHPRLTARSMVDIADAAADRFDISALHIVHRCGEVGPGEPIVFVAAASAHRRAAFEAADYLMDRLKTEAPFWKKETGPDGERWIEPRPRDYEDVDRWRPAP